MKNEEQSEIFDVSNIKANVYFFIPVRIDEFKKKIIDDKIIPDSTHLNILKTEIDLLDEKFNDELESKNIKINKIFYEHLISLKEISKNNSLYA